MTFENVYKLLLWFYCRRWLRPPKPPGNHSYVYDGTKRQDIDLEDTWPTFCLIADTIETLPNREQAMLRDLFTEHDVKRVAEKMDLSTRRIRQIRQAMIKKLEKCFLESGLIKEHVSCDPPIYAQEA